MTDLKIICRRALDAVGGRADGAEVMCGTTTVALTRFASNGITQNVVERQVGVTLRVQKDGRTARAGTNRLDDASLKRAADAALDLARLQKPDREPQPILPPQTYRSVPGPSAATSATTPAERADLAAGVAAICKKAGLRANGYVTTDTDTTAIANTAGLFASHTDTVAELSCTAVGDGGMAGWAAATERDRRRLDPGTVGRRAVEKSLASRHPKAAPAGRYTVVLEPAAVADLLAFWAWEAFGGLSFVEGRSCLSGKIGEKLLHPSVTIVDDAGHPRTMGAPFDAEGAPRLAVTLVEKGTIRGVVHDRVTAARAGVASTGHALPQPNPWGPLAANLVLNPGKDSLESLIGKVDRGLLITEFHYTNVLDPMTLTVTGMTRNGTFLIEKGAVGPAVKNMRFTQSLVEAFQHVAGIGKDLEFRRGFFGGGFVCPAIILDGFTFSSGTQF